MMYDVLDTYVDPVLTSISVGYEAQDLYATRLVPLTPVIAQSGEYMVFDRSSWILSEDRRAPGTVAHEIRGGKWSKDNFFVEEHSLQAAVADEETENQSNNVSALSFADIDPEADATELVTGTILRNLEKKVSDYVRNLSNYPVGNKVTLSGTAQFNDPAADPVAVFKTAIKQFKAQIGRAPNVALIPDIVWTEIVEHPSYRARFENFQLTPEDAFRRLTQYDGQIILADSVYNASNNIDAAETITSFWGKDIILAVVDAAGGQRTRTWAKLFCMPYDGQVRQVDRWRETVRKSDIVRCSMRYDFKIVSSYAGYIIKNAIA